MAYLYPQYQQYQQYQAPQYQPQSNTIQWVQGLEGAKAYPISPGGSVLLMDSDNQYLYIKTADNAGMPSLKIYEYHEVTEVKPEKQDFSRFVTKEELAEVLSNLEVKKKKKRVIEEDEDDE